MVQMRAHSEVELPVLVIIPARGGSKRIPKKNIRPFFGIPILTRVIDEIGKCSFVKTITVSTDSEEIAHIAQISGVNVQNRPAALADDDAGLLEVMRHEITEFSKVDNNFRYVCCVLPTAVLMDASDLSKAVEQIKTASENFLISIGKYSSPIWRGLQVDPNGQMSMIFPENVGSRTQDLPNAYHDAGQFYVAHRETWLTASSILNHDFRGVEVSALRVQDIDDEADWIQAEQAFQLLNRVTPWEDQHG
jgi:pseudaminic acid cytidylyltransferase